MSLRRKLLRSLAPALAATPRLVGLAGLAGALAIGSAGCGGQGSSYGGGEVGDKWVARARDSYKAGDFEDAQEAASSALKASPNNPEVKLLNARIALARLDLSEAVKLLEGVAGTEAHGLRGRAHWYLGDIEQAAEELEAMLADPSVKDPWAREIAKLARRGTGRHPFQMEGGMITAVDMPKVGPILLVPCELEGERILAVVSTSSGEVVLDSNSRKESAWVNLRFGDHVEVKDVPAITQDLSAFSRQFGAPIKALLGVNFLRHVHVTFDRRGDQFILRREDPQQPPEASRVPLFYVRGGGLLLRANLGAQKDAPRSTFLVDSSVVYPMALEDETWRKAGVDLAKLQPEPAVGPGAKSGSVPSLKIGSFDLPNIPAVQGIPLTDLKANVDVDLGGVVGAGLLQAFRVTLAEEGRVMWLEPDPEITGPGADPRSGRAMPPPGTDPGPGAAPQAPGSPGSPAAPSAAPPAAPSGKPGSPAPAPAGKKPAPAAAAAPSAPAAKSPPAATNPAPAGGKK